MAELSVIIVTHRRPAKLTRCLRSIAEAWLPPSSEVIVALNGHDAESEEAAEKAREWLDSVKIIRAPGVVISAARNMAATSASGEILYYIDDDVSVGPDLFRTAMAKFAAHPGVGVIGGPNLTPPGSSLFQLTAGQVMANPCTAPHGCGRYRAYGSDRLGD